MTIHENYLFGTLLKDPDICRGDPAADPRRPHRKYPLSECGKSDRGYYSKGIRMDIYTDLPDQSVCCIEMQVRRVRVAQFSVLPRRTRYYHSAIDTSILEKGEDCPDLSKSILIVICIFDEFEQGLHRYTFRNACAEKEGLLLEDGAETMILNTRSSADDISPELRRFLDFVNGAPAPEDDPFLCKLEDKIQEIMNIRIGGITI